MNFEFDEVNVDIDTWLMQKEWDEQRDEGFDTFDAWNEERDVCTRK